MKQQLGELEQGHTLARTELMGQARLLEATVKELGMLKAAKSRGEAELRQQVGGMGGGQPRCSRLGWWGGMGWVQSKCWDSMDYIPCIEGGRGGGAMGSVC